MTLKRLASLLASALMLASIGCDDAEPPAIPLLVVKVEDAPVVDGLIDPGVWDTARRAVLALHKSHGRAHRPEKIEAVVRAVYTDERVVFLVQWRDECQSDKYRPYVWDTIGEKEKYVVGTSIDDGAALIFQTATQHDARRPGQTECWADLWEWGAGRTNATTYARDAMLLGADRVRRQALPSRLDAAATVGIRPRR